MRRHFANFALLFAASGTLPAAAEQLESQELSIVGGEYANAGEWPELAYLSFPTGGKSASHCSGVLTEPNVILTAAHCVWSPLHMQELARLHEELAGREIRISDYREQRASLVDSIAVNAVFNSLIASAVIGASDLAEAKNAYAVIGYAMHPVGFGNASGELKRAAARLLDRHAEAETVAYHHDLAVLYLDRPVTGVTPLMLLEPDSASVVGEGARLRVLGFGNNNPRGDEFDGHLRELDVNVRMSDCDASCDASAEVAVRAADNQSPCHGDSGGPALVGTERGLRVAGIASRFTSTTIDRTRPCDGQAALVYGLTASSTEWYESVRLGPPATATGGGCGGCSTKNEMPQMALWLLAACALLGRRRRKR